MQKDDYILLIYKCLKGEQSPSELEELEAWTRASEANRQLREQLEEDWRRSGDYQPQLEVDMAGDFEQLRQRMRAHKAKEDKPEAIQRSLPGRRSWLSIAAAVAVLVVATLWWLNRDGAAAERLLVQTAEGERRSVTLTDGTVVALNENSRLWYPPAFASGERRVELEGEGFFEVTRNETAPFIIATRLANVRVLGTSFNLEAQPGQQKVVLDVMTGRVEMTGNNRSSRTLVDAGQRAIYQEEGENELLEVQINAGAWRNRVFRFNDQTLSNVIADLEKVFGVSIAFDSALGAECRFAGRFQNTDVKKILESIADTFKMQLEETDASSYLLKGGQCN